MACFMMHHIGTRLLCVPLTSWSALDACHCWKTSCMQLASDGPLFQLYHRPVFLPWASLRQRSSIQVYAALKCEGINNHPTKQPLPEKPGDIKAKESFPFLRSAVQGGVLKAS